MLKSFKQGVEKMKKDEKHFKEFWDKLPRALIKEMDNKEKLLEKNTYLLGLLAFQEGRIYQLDQKIY